MKDAIRKIKIRPMRANDIEQAMEIAAGLKELAFWTSTQWAEALASQGAGRRSALVAEAAGAVVGFAVASVVGSEAELESIAVERARQRQGLGRQLWTALLTGFGATGVTHVFLEVRASNRQALRFYRSLGFAETGRRPHYYADPVEDAALLGLRLG